MDHFVLHSEYQPTGDQPQAIKALADGFAAGNRLTEFRICCFVAFERRLSDSEDFSEFQVV